MTLKHNMIKFSNYYVAMFLFLRMFCTVNISFSKCEKLAKKIRMLSTSKTRLDQKRVSHKLKNIFNILKVIFSAAKISNIKITLFKNPRMHELKDTQILCYKIRIY